MKKIIISALLIVGISHILSAQTMQGKVVEAGSSAPLAGATININGLQKTTTAFDGTFTLPCETGKTISVSFVGYNAYSQKLNNCNSFLTISLQNVVNTLKDVQITATSTLNKSILYQPNSIVKLDALELKRGNGLFLDDAINTNVPGVSMNRRAVSSGQQFNIRGYGNGSRGTRGVSSNFDGQGYKVYLNGIPITDAEGITVLDDIDYGSIGNVEVTKGPSGTLYGLAIAGVVNLSTVQPPIGKTSVSQEALVGNYGLQRFTTQFAKATKTSTILANYGQQESDGFTVHNASKKTFVNFAGSVKASEQQSLNAYFGYSNSYDERSGELTVSQWKNDDYSGNINYIRNNGHSEVYTLRAGLSHIYDFNKHITNTTTIFGTGFNSNVSSAGGWGDKAATNLGLRSTFSTKFTLDDDITLSGLTGIETQRQNASAINYSMIDPQGAAHKWKLGDPYFIIGSYAAGNNGTTANVYTETSTSSLFTEWTLALQHDFSITGGIGYSLMKIGLDDRIYAPGKPTHYDTTYKKMFSPHFAINKVFSKEISAYASYNRAYKAPVSAYFYIPYASVGGPQTGIVNDQLSPEKGDQVEIGTKGALGNGKLSYQLALFQTVYNNKFTTVAVPYNSTTTLFSYVTNGGKQVNKGIEALVKYNIVPAGDGFISAVQPFANATYSDFEYKNYPFHIIKGAKDSIVNYKGNKVAGVAKWVANAGVDFSTKPGIYGNLTYSYKDALPITSDNLLFTDSYNLLSGKLGFRKSLSSHFDLDTYVGVNNITGTKYPIMVFVNQIPDAYIAGPRDANYFGAINLKYSF